MHHAKELIMKVFCGKLVHSLVPEKTEVLYDYCIGYDENDNGKVSQIYSLTVLYMYIASCIIFKFNSMVDG